MHVKVPVCWMMNDDTTFGPSNSLRHFVRNVPKADFTNKYIARFVPRIIHPPLPPALLFHGGADSFHPAYLSQN
ncbi:hypothetical protein ANO14919_076090 [Xylariales sp. No.14919]|nr:hypothetical protein ANO14919_076090 [Xylariales sp. No.14919]